MLNREKSSISLFVRNSCERRRVKHPEEAAFCDTVILHSQILLDMTDRLTINRDATMALIRALLKLPSHRYLSVFDELDTELLAATREGGNCWEVFLQSVRNLGVPRQFNHLFETLPLSTESVVEGFRMLHQYFAFPLRLNMPGADSAITGLLEINATRDNFLPSERLIALAKEIVNGEFVDDVRRWAVFHHGTGSTAYYKGDTIRTRLLAPFEKDRLLDLSWLRATFAGTPLEEHFHCYPTSDAPVGRRTPSVVMSVPKSWKKQRIVAIEDCTRMYAQQGVRSGLYAAITKSDVLKSVIDFERSELNCHAARLGSLLGGYATVDLSSASDSVGYNFVKVLLEQTPLWTVIEPLSTKEFWTEEHGRIESRIFATMGNAICFPILTLVCALITMEALDQYNLPKDQWSFRVYGDDIVVPDECTTELFALLSKYGFTVNEKKSYYGPECRFRESCGGEYLAGEDVTPLRISRKFLGLSPDLGYDNMMALIDLHNRCSLYDFRSTRNLLAKILSQDFTLHLPFSGDFSVGLWSIDPPTTMKDYDRQWNAGYQRMEYVCDSFYSRKRRAPRDPEIGLAEWLQRTHVPGLDGAERSLRVTNCIPRSSERTYIARLRNILAKVDWQIKWEETDPTICSSTMSSGRVSCCRHHYSYEMAQCYRSDRKSSKSGKAEVLPKNLGDVWKRLNPDTLLGSSKAR